MGKYSSTLISKLKRNLGFTMTEIVIIALVIGILSAIAMPSLNRMLESVRIEQAIASVRTTVSQSQRAAIRNREYCESSVLVKLKSKKSKFNPDVSSSCVGLSSEDLPKDVSIYSNVNVTPMSDVVASQPNLVASNALIVSDSQPILFADSGDDDDLSNGKGNKYGHDKKNQKKSCTLTLGLNPKLVCDDGSSSTEEPKTPKSWRKWNRKNCKAWGCTSSGLRNTGVVNLEYGQNGSINYGLPEESTTATGMIVATSSNNPNGRKKCLAVSRRIGLTRLGNYEGQISADGLSEAGECTTQSWREQK